MPDCLHCNGSGKTEERATVGMVVRMVRVRTGWTLRRLARALDISPPYLSDVEHDRRRMTASRVEAAINAMVSARKKGGK